MQNNIEQSPTPETADCISASELVHRHLQDENHEISEQDLQMVAIDCSDTNSVENAADTSISNSLDSNLKDSTKDEKGEKEEDDIIITPLDVLAS